MNILWGHGNCGGIPRLHSYDEAKAHFEKVVPLRGRTPTLKPLGKNRRFTWYEIRENTIANQAENKEYKTYACNLYGRDTVTFFPNGDIVINTTGWRDVTTGMFINCVLNGLGNIVSESGKWFFKNHKHQAFRFITEMHLTKNEEGAYVPTEIVHDEAHRLNRKAMNAIRKKYLPIIEYGKTMLSLSPTIEKMEQMVMSKLGIQGGRCLPHGTWESKDVATNRARWFALADKYLESGDLDLLYDIASYVAFCAGHYSYRNDSYSCNPESYVRAIDEMIKFNFRDELFITEKLPVGVSCADRNKKYFYLKTYGN